MPRCLRRLVLDINCEVDYTRIDKRILGWIMLFRANTFKEAYECIKYNEILKGVIEDMKEYANEDYVKEYSIQEKLYRSNINGARREGRNEGIKLGRNEGIDYANLIMAQKLRDRDMDPKDIVDITGLPLNKVLSLKKNEHVMVREEKTKYNELSD